MPGSPVPFLILVRSANFLVLVRGILAVVRGYPLSYALRAYFAGRYHRGRIFHFSTAKALRNGYDSLSQPAVTAPPAVRRVPISYVLTDLLLGRLSHGPY